MNLHTKFEAFIMIRPPNQNRILTSAHVPHHGDNRKRNHAPIIPRVIGIGLASVILTIITLYLCWVASPIDLDIATENHAGITKQDIDASLSYARSQGQFSDALIQRLSKKSKWQPWNRGIMFMTIEGDPDHIRVSAGYHGGGMAMDGGVINFTGNRTPEGWSFEMKDKWIK